MIERSLYVMAEFDQQTSQEMQDLESLLRAQGFTGQQSPNLPHHITLCVEKLENEARLRAHLQQVCSRTRRFELPFNHIGLFGLKVLFLAPDVNRDLLDLYEQVCLDGPSGQDWTAHATLWIDESPVILKALPLIAGHFSSIRARVERISLYEFWPTRFIARYDLL